MIVLYSQVVSSKESHMVASKESSIVCLLVSIDSGILGSKVSLCGSSWPKAVVLLSQPLECWDYG